MFNILKKKFNKVFKSTSEKITKTIPKKITQKQVSDKDLKFLEEMELELLEADVAYEVIEKIKQDLKKNLVGKKIKRGQVKKIIQDAFKNSLKEILETPKLNLKQTIKKNKPCLIVLLGFNGSGKTTTLAKLSKYLKSKGFSSVFAAADTFRAASIEQLEEHAGKLNVKVIKHNYGADSAAVIFDAKKHAENRKIDVVLADTAGRSHANANLMDELKKVCRVNKPDLKILVLDSMTGNDIINQCETFDKAVGVDAVILSKLDVSDKGGSVLSAAYVLKKPILFLGIGQKYKDLLEYEKNIILKKII